MQWSNLWYPLGMFPNKKAGGVDLVLRPDFLL